MDDKLKIWEYKPASAEASVTPTFDGWEDTAAAAHSTFVRMRNERLHWTPLQEPLEACRVALMTTGGVHHRDDPPFDTAAHNGDWSARRIPNDVDPSELLVSHTHYNHADADRDINCMFPLAPLNAFAQEGRVGSVAPTHYGLMGFAPDPTPMLEETVPNVAEGLRADDVDIVILSPG